MQRILKLSEMPGGLICISLPRMLFHSCLHYGDPLKALSILVFMLSSIVIAMQGGVGHPGSLPGMITLQVMADFHSSKAAAAQGICRSGVQAE